MIYMKPCLSLKECSIINNFLTINVSCNMDYDPDVFEPKLKVHFDNGKENLLLPIVEKKRHYFSFKNEDYIEFKYKFRIDELFDNNNLENSTFYLYLIYGNQIIDDIAVDKYSMDVFKSTSKYVIKLNKNDEKAIFSFQIKKSASASYSYTLKNVLSYIIRIFALIVSIFLIPFFIIESLFIVIKTPNLDSSGGFLYLEDQNHIKRGIRHVLWRMSKFSNFPIEEEFINFKNFFLDKLYQLLIKFSLKNNTIMFISERGNELTGNLKFVYDYLKNHEDINIKVSTINESFPITSFNHRWKTYRDMAKSNVIILDNYFYPVNFLNFHNQTLVQLWHACGAFKTFGFSRLGRPGGPKLDAKAHRKYDMATVSGTSIIDCYAEAYGISDDKVLPLGVPRTDIFFDNSYSKFAKDKFYSKYPKLKDKKIILFGPTFRGTSRKTGYYPDDAFDPINLYNSLNQEYAIIIKRHFFINNKFNIPKEYSDYIIDLNVSEDINDLLFVTDILITDYSSTVFEASLLDIPMLFYAFDLDEYISERSFYFEYKGFVPGKITYDKNELLESIKNKDFEKFKINDFKEKFFDDTDGKSTERIANYILNSLKKDKSKD